MKQEWKNWFESFAGLTIKEFTLHSFVGSGKIGFVYKAYEKTSDWEVAVKITPVSRNDEWPNEIKKVSKLSTISGVVHFHRIDTDLIRHKGHTETVNFTVWDFIRPGRNLRQYLENTKNVIQTSFLVAVVEQILRILHACHKKGVVRHGDLHAGNILIGDADEGDIDASLHPREQIFVSDFGYGATGGTKTPKDDYRGLADISNAIIQRINWDKTTPDDRQLLLGIQHLLAKVLKEGSAAEKAQPLDILRGLQDLKSTMRPIGIGIDLPRRSNGNEQESEDPTLASVGQFQISEMLGERWEWWKKLFVATVPARSRIFVPDISTVVTGPRGCGKTMLFRRLSERLIVECGPVGDALRSDMVGFYVNANDIADAFPDFPENPSQTHRDKLVCYASLCILSDILTVLAARKARCNEEPPDSFVRTVRDWLIIKNSTAPLLSSENMLDNLRSQLEAIKWTFPKNTKAFPFPSCKDFSRISWLENLIKLVRTECPWIGGKLIFIFIDDYSTPRVTQSMQRTLNRLLLQRSSEFVSKIATESATTFLPEDSSGKMLQDGDDYQLIDVGEESLFMKEDEREEFLNSVFERRLSLDPRIPKNGRNLSGFLGRLNLSKTEFARRLRMKRADMPPALAHKVTGESQRRGATKPNVLYHGADVFASLWSGDTRIMIQLIQELSGEVDGRAKVVQVPVSPEKQNRVFSDRGGTWLDAQVRNHPTDPKRVAKEVRQIQRSIKGYQFTGNSYGAHLKAIVEAFVVAARQLLFGPVYKIGKREVPRMAFRIEVTDEFRLEPLVGEIYRDLIRYGLFMRDARGKSVRGAMVPRLFMRRLLIPFCTLALSKRDSVQMTCESFSKLLLTPDIFKDELSKQLSPKASIEQTDQIVMPFIGIHHTADPLYDDLTDADFSTDEHHS